MLDIRELFPENYFGSVFFCLVLFLLLLFFTIYKKKDGRSNVFFLWILCSIFVEFAFWGGDYYHYIEAVEKMRITNYDYLEVMNQVHMESPYWIIAEFCGYNYLYFRFIIWCGSIILLYIICHCFSIESNIFLYYFVPIALLSVSGSRVCICMTLALWGWFLFVYHWDKKKNFSIIYFIISASIIVISSFFHKSSYFFVALLFISLIDLDAKRSKILVLLLPFFSIIISTYMIPYLMGVDASEEGYINYRSAQGYMERGMGSYGLPTWISLILSYLLYCYMAFFILYSIKKGEYRKWPLIVRKLANLTFYIFIFSVPFVFTSATYTMFYRFMAFMLLPAVFLFTLLKQEGYNYKLCKYIYTVAVICMLYSLGLSLLSTIK